MSEFPHKDLYLTPDEFIELFRQVAKESLFFTGDSWSMKQHPEDLAYNMQAVFDSMGNTLINYLLAVRERMNERETSNPPTPKSQSESGGYL